MVIRSRQWNLLIYLLVTSKLLYSTDVQVGLFTSREKARKRHKRDVNNAEELHVDGD